MGLGPFESTTGSGPPGVEGSPQSPSPGSAPAPGQTGGAANSTARQSGGSLDVVGSIPELNVPQGSGTLLNEGASQFRFAIERPEGLDTKRSATEIGELQFVTIKNGLTDDQTIRKRKASDDVNSSGSTAQVGLHEVSGLRELTLDAMDAVTGWTESDAANFSRTLETTKKVEGTGSLRLNATGSGANGDTIKKDLGAGSTVDLSKFDYVEIMLRGVVTSGNSLDFGISEDDVTYTTTTYSGTTTETWEMVRLDISALSATARDAIRYLKFTATNGATAQIWYADIIRAVKRVQHRLSMRRTSGSSTGGVRDNPGSVSLSLDSDESGIWLSKGVIESVPANTKMRAVDWFGTTHIMLGAAGAMKYANGVFSVWEEAPPSLDIALHYEKLWALSQMHDPYGLRHSTVNSTTVWPTSTSPVGGDGGLLYVGRRYGYLPTGLRSAFGQLFVWTEGDLWILFGTSNNTFELQRSHPGAGTLSRESICVFDQGLIWHDGMSDRMLMWRGGNVVDIGVPIQSTLRAIPSARKPWTAGVCDGRFYVFSYTRNGQTVNDESMVFDTDLQRWHGPFTGNWVGFTSGYMGVDGSVYVGTEANGIRKWSEAVSGAEGSRDFAVKSGASNYRMPGWRKRIRRFRLKGENLTAGQVFTLKFYADLSASAVRTYTLTAAGGATEVLSTGVDNDVLGEHLQWELTESSANAVTLSQVILDGYYIRALR